MVQKIYTNILTIQRYWGAFSDIMERSNEGHILYINIDINILEDSSNEWLHYNRRPAQALLPRQCLPDLERLGAYQNFC